ncbi:MAG: ABC transporter ATP-binding protein [Sulfurovum sp.]|nr:ABC transporter ATP-binding protein [Sulfurovum sp.]
MIEISNLSKDYGEHKVLKDISLHMDTGSIYGLLGPNGAGKTTLISTLVGLCSFDAGEIHIEGKNIKDSLGYIQSISSLIPQELAFYPTLTAAENLEYFAGMLGLKNNALKERIDKVVHLTQLSDAYTKQAQTYSGGLKRRLNIAIGLLSDPKIIYLDEPTVGIDPQSRNFILESIKKMKEENKLIVYTSHYMNEVEFLCDKIAIIDNGEIIQEGSLDTILSDTKAIIKTSDEYLEVALSQISDTLHRLEEEGKKITSIEYGHDLESYFLRITNTKLRD